VETPGGWLGQADLVGQASGARQAGLSSVEVSRRQLGEAKDSVQHHDGPVVSGSSGHGKTVASFSLAASMRPR
jgi:hypothetical protein